MRTLVHTALEPTQHMLSPHHAKFKPGFSAVDETGRAVAEAPATLKCVCTLRDCPFRAVVQDLPE